MIALYRLGHAVGVRYSDLLELREAGYDSEARLGFDLAVEAFGTAFESERTATREVAATESRRRRATKQVPKHDEVTLRLLLGLDDDDDEMTDPMIEQMARDLLTGAVDWTHLGMEQ